MQILSPSEMECTYLTQQTQVPFSGHLLPLSSLRSVLEFAGGKVSRLVFTKGYRQLVGWDCPPSGEHVGSVQMTAAEVTVTHTQGPRPGHLF